MIIMKNSMTIFLKNKKRKDFDLELSEGVCCFSSRQDKGLEKRKKRKRKSYRNKNGSSCCGGKSFSIQEHNDKI